MSLHLEECFLRNPSLNDYVKRIKQSCVYITRLCERSEGTTRAGKTLKSSLRGATRRSNRVLYHRRSLCFPALWIALSLTLRAMTKKADSAAHFQKLFRAVAPNVVAVRLHQFL